MKARIVRWWAMLRGSYWFVPGLMTVGAIVFSFVFINLDQRFGAQWMRDWSYLYASKPEGARALLSTIAGSMIGVAGVTFSITIAAVAYASSSFGPRILTSFMRDTGNQVTLGTFIATYVYCLLILRTVRSGDETLFVPHLSVLFGVAMALASLAVLIFFIHHIPRSIHVGNVVAEIGREMLRKADSLYPEEGQDPSPSAPAPVESAEGEAVRSEHTGYVQTVDLEGLRGRRRSISYGFFFGCDPEIS